MTLILILWMLSAAAMPGQPVPQPKAVQEVRPGDPSVNGSFIEPYANQWKMIQQAADGSRSEVGKWTDQVRIIEQDGEQLIQRTQAIYGPQGEKQSEMVNLTVRSTLLPRRFQRSSGGSTMEMAFDGAQVKIGRPDLSNAREVDLKMPVFDWTLYGLLLAAFPLEEGYSARFPYFAGNVSGFYNLEWMSFEVKGRQPVAAAGRQVEAWLAETEQGWKFWLTKQAPYVIRLEIPAGNGAAQIWEM